MLRTKRDGRRLALGRERITGAECAAALSVDMKLQRAGPADIASKAVGARNLGGRDQAHACRLAGGNFDSIAGAEFRPPERWQSG